MEIKLNIGGESNRGSIIPHGGSIPGSVRGHTARPTSSRTILGKRGKGGRDLITETVLAEGRKQEQNIIDMINNLQKAGIGGGIMKEYDELLVQLGDVEDVIKKALERLGQI